MDVARKWIHQFQAPAVALTGHSAGGLGAVQGNGVQISHAVPSTVLANDLETLFVQPCSPMILRPIGTGTPTTSRGVLRTTPNALFSRMPCLRIWHAQVESRYDGEMRARVNIKAKEFRFHDQLELLRLLQLWTNKVGAQTECGTGGCSHAPCGAQTTRARSGDLRPSCR